MKLKESDKDLDPLKITQTGRGGYTVTLNNFYKATGRSLSEALHDLANQFDALDMFGSEEFDTSAEAIRKRCKPCKYCGAKIFFAVTENMKWMPVDGSSIFAPTLNQFPVEDTDMATSIPGAVWTTTGPEQRRTMCYTILERDGHPTVRSIRKPQGQVWIAHQNVCGVREAPEDLGLKERWNRNRGGLDERNVAIQKQLEQTIRDLA